LTIRPGRSAADFAADLDLFRELGVTRVNTVSMDPDRARSFDEFARLAELAAQRGMVTTLELAPGLTVPDLATALAAVAHVGQPDFRLLIDTMHWVRSGAGPDDLAKLDPGLIDYVQLSDAPRAPRFASYHEEAMFERMVPGEGELDLAGLLAVLPPDRVYALEIPQRAAALAGQAPRERLARCVAATRQLLAAARGPSARGAPA
jgi:sugar phosphate isomerase/epimerase